MLSMQHRPWEKMMPSGDSPACRHRL